MSADAGITRQNYRDAALTQPVANGTSFAGSTTHLLQSSGSAAIIDPEAGSTYKEEIVAGVEFEVANNVSLGVRYIHRTMPQILEDIGQLAVYGYFYGPCGDAVVDYFITNVNASTPPWAAGPAVGLLRGPDPQVRLVRGDPQQELLEQLGHDRLLPLRQAEGQLRGLLPLGQRPVRPGHQLAVRLPDQRLDLHRPRLRGSEGFVGDIRYQGTTQGEGVLPNDRPHQIKIYGNYTFGALNLGLGFNWGTGRSLTSLASNPVYANAGEIPVTLRGEGFQTVDGFADRAPSDTALDLHADYTFKLNDKQRLVLLATSSTCSTARSRRTTTTPGDHGRHAESELRLCPERRQQLVRLVPGPDGRALRSAVSSSSRIAAAGHGRPYTSGGGSNPAPFSFPRPGRDWELTRRCACPPSS